MVLAETWDFEEWEAALVHPSTSAVDLSQPVSGSQADVQLDGAQIEMLTLNRGWRVIAKVCFARSAIFSSVSVSRKINKG